MGSEEPSWVQVWASSALTLSPGSPLVPGEPVGPAGPASPCEGNIHSAKKKKKKSIPIASPAPPPQQKLHESRKKNLATPNLLTSALLISSEAMSVGSSGGFVDVYSFQNLFPALKTTHSCPLMAKIQIFCETSGHFLTYTYPHPGRGGQRHFQHSLFVIIVK